MKFTNLNYWLLTAVLFLVPIFSYAENFGYDSIGGTNETTGTANVFVAYGTFALTEDAASLDTFNIYIRCSTANGTHIRMAVYADSAGNPGAKLASSAELTTSGCDTWQSVAITGTPSLSAGNYWLGYISDAELLTKVDTSSGTGKFKTGVTYGVLSDPAPSGLTGAGTVRGSLYVSYTPAPVCGDGAIDAGEGEECDDSGTSNGDGCSSTCLVEDGWECVGEPSECTESSSSSSSSVVVDFGTGSMLVMTALCNGYEVVEGTTEDESGTYMTTTPVCNDWAYGLEISYVEYWYKSLVKIAFDSVLLFLILVTAFYVLVFKVFGYFFKLMTRYPVRPMYATFTKRPLYPNKND